MCRIFVLALCMAILTSCGRDSDADSNRPLPENSGIEASRLQQYLGRLPAESRVWCQEWIDGDELLPTPHISTAQLRVALEQLHDEEQYGNQPPVVLYAIRWVSPEGKDFVVFHDVSTSRETAVVRLTYAAVDGTVVEVAYDLRRTEKHKAIITLQDVPIERVEWERILARCETVGKMHKLRLNTPDSIPFPQEGEIRAALAVQDRSGRLSNAVPVETDRE